MDRETALITTALLFGVSVIYGILLTKKTTPNQFNNSSKDESIPESVSSNQTNDIKVSKKKNNEANEAEDTYRILTPDTITIAYASTTGTCYKMAHKLYDGIKQRLPNHPKIQIHPIHLFDWWDEFLNNENASKDATSNPPILIFLLPTWTNGTLPPPVANNKSLETSFPNLLDALYEITTDWRIPKKALASSNLSLSVFGLGSSEYAAQTFCKPAKDIHRLLIAKLGAKRLLIHNKPVPNSRKQNWNLCLGDESVGDVERTTFQEWMNQIVQRVSDIHTSQQTNDQSNDDICGCKSTSNTKASTCCQNPSNPQTDSAGGGSSDEDYLSSDDEESVDENEPDVMDMEDMGNAMTKKTNVVNPSEPPEMVTPKQALALKKEGYKLIGTHSAVKLCRWTKHQLRGRGGCYKHTFYGITSYQCMEATPSLACANKCTFLMFFYNCSWFTKIVICFSS